MSYGCYARPIAICTETAVVWVNAPITGTGLPGSPLTIDWDALSTAEACSIVTLAMADPLCLTALCTTIGTAACIDFCTLTTALPDFGALQCV